MPVDPVEEPFAIVVDTLAAEPGWSVVSRAGSAALLRSEEGRAVAVVRLGGEAAPEVDRAGAEGARLEILALGGDAGAVEAFFPAEATPVGWIHVGADRRQVARAADDEPLWVAAWLNRHPDVEEAIRRHARRSRMAQLAGVERAAPAAPAPPEPVEARFGPGARRPSALRAFWGSGEPAITWGVIAVCVVMFALEVYTGAYKDGARLLQLGALPASPVSFATPWLLLSYAFLHGDIAHLGFNMVAIWSMGMWLERVLGRARYWLLYLSGALGGGLLIVLSGTGGLTVGASGAAWALMTGSAWLVWRAPEAVGLGAREVLLPMLGRNLFLNLILSMLPGVSWAGHFGGGIAGAAVMAAIIAHARWVRRTRGAATPTWMIALATLGVVAAFGALLTALLTGPTLVRMLMGE